MAVDLGSFRTDNLFLDLAVIEYDISPNEKKVAFTSLAADGSFQIWVASLDRRSPPQRVPATVLLDAPAFASDDEIYVRALENGKHYLQRMRLDGSGRGNVFADSVLEFFNLSPDRKWVVVSEPVTSEHTTAHVAAHAADGSGSMVLCDFCAVRWSSDQKVMYFNFGFGTDTPKTIVALPTVPGKMFPALPPEGVTIDEALKIPGAKQLEKFPEYSPVPGVFAYYKHVIQRNIYRIPLR